MCQCEEMLSHAAAERLIRPRRRSGCHGRHAGELHTRASFVLGSAPCRHGDCLPLCTVRGRGPGTVASSLRLFMVGGDNLTDGRYTWVGSHQRLPQRWRRLVSVNSDVLGDTAGKQFLGKWAGTSDAPINRSDAKWQHVLVASLSCCFPLHLLLHLQMQLDES